MLNVMIGDQVKETTLRKDRLVIVDRSIPEVEDQSRGDPVSVNSLRVLAGCKQLCCDWQDPSDIQIPPDPSIAYASLSSRASTWTPYLLPKTDSGMR
jgi:hypothetical protein